MREMGVRCSLYRRWRAALLGGKEHRNGRGTLFIYVVLLTKRECRAFGVGVVCRTNNCPVTTTLGNDTPPPSSVH